MAEEARFTPRTYEELLMGRLGKLFDAKEEGNGYLFDEVIDEIEGLFGLAPEIHNVFMAKKKELSIDADDALNRMKIEISSLNADDITKDVLKTQKIAIIQWEYRSDLLDEIILILNEYQMIPYQTAIASAEMEYGELEEPVEVEPIETPPPAPPAQTPPPLKQEQYPQPRKGLPVPPSISEPLETVSPPSTPPPPALTPKTQPSPPPPKTPPPTDDRKRIRPADKNE